MAFALAQFDRTEAIRLKFGLTEMNHNGLLADGLELLDKETPL